MSEFEWRRGLRELGGPVQPEHDLWPHIAARLAPAEQIQVPVATWKPRRWFPVAVAASLIVCAVIVAPRLRHGDAIRVATQSATEAAQARYAHVSASLRAASPRDPRLAGAAIELDAAASQIEQMLAAQPDAVFLVGLLNRTNERRLKLARMGLVSG